MAKVNKDNFGFLGNEFQIRLIAQILVDTKFAESIIDIIDPNYFDDQYLKVIVSIIKDAHELQQVIPDMGSLEIRIRSTIANEIEMEWALAQLKKVKEANLNDYVSVQEEAMLFCKQKELNKTIKKIQTIIDTNDLNRYHECEELLKKALEHGMVKDDGINVLDNIEDVLADDFRKPIPTGIKGLDEIMNGGLAKSELGVILAPFGVGKTTMITKIANTAKDLGYNVLQIFFEDTKKIIQRKHLSCWSGIELNNLSLYKDELKALVEKKRNEKGVLKLKKFPSDGTTIPIIRQYIRKLIARGFRPDIILVDYIDCVQASKKIDDANVAEGSVMRQFETLLAEFDMAGWTAVQGNRSSIKAEVVESDQMGGSIKKGQIGHFIASIAKGLDQKENGTANIAILKSRFGKDGIVFQNIKFDNARIQIDMSEDIVARTQGEFKRDKEKQDTKLVSDILNNVKANKARQKALSGDENVSDEQNN